jgi:hypothetical protein
MSHLRKTATGAAAATALGLAVLGIVPGQAAAEATATATHVDDVDGCVVSTDAQYDATTNQASLKVVYHNGKLTEACRETSGAKLTFVIPGTNVRVAYSLPVHKTMACGWLDPTCPHDVNESFTDYNAVPAPIKDWSVVSMHVKTVAGYQTTVWN